MAGADCQVVGWQDSGVGCLKWQCAQTFHGLHAVTSPGSAAVIGVFDSGVGGLSVLRHIRAALPTEHLLYLADAGFAPYGERSEAQIVVRSLAAAFFLAAIGAKAMVVACNTATAAAIDAIRLQYPALIVVGVEPGLKPAAELSVSRTVGVLATAATLGSARFAQLQAQVTAATGIRFLLQPCAGLASQVEKGALRAPSTARLVTSLVRPLLDQDVDTLVLGCTHYPFVQPLIEAAVAAHGRSGNQIPVQIVDTGSAVARQLAVVLRGRGQLTDGLAPGSVTAYSTGSCSTLQQAFKRLLALSVPVTGVVLTGAAADYGPVEQNAPAV
ncbi:MAG: glutamate racemase [Herminiimonas sp.]|nr:glutamate racemase [Herminiimonas sp.]